MRSYFVAAPYRRERARDTTCRDLNDSRARAGSYNSKTRLVPCVYLASSSWRREARRCRCVLSIRRETLGRVNSCASQVGTCSGHYNNRSKAPHESTPPRLPDP
jgi:hypothetical protein